MGSRSETDDGRGQSILDLVEDWYQIPALLLVVGAMFAFRMQSYSNFIRDGEVFFSGNDAWYHYRSTMYTVQNWPSTMPFDPWTGFPYGTFAGQFGTLYDQIVATVALIVGLGSPSPELVAKTLLVAPAVAGALAVIPVYFIGKRLAGRLSGLFGAVVLMLLPGSFLNRTLVGVADHNAVEPLVMALGVAGLVVALQKAEETMPVWEVIREELFERREVDTLSEPLKWSLFAGFLVGIYIWTWPPGVVLVGIVGVFLLVKIPSDVVNERTPEPTAFAVATSMFVVAVMALISLEITSFSTNDPSLLQPGAALSVAVAAVFFSWLARVWESTNLDTNLYPVAVAGIAVVGIGVLAILPIGVVDSIANNLLRIVGFSAGATARTIGEAQPFIAPSTLQRYGVEAAGRISIEYGLTFFTGLAAAVWLHTRPLVKRGSTRAYGYVAGALAVIALIFLVPAIPGGIESVTGVDEQVAGLLIVSALIVGSTFLADYDADKLFLVVWAVFITSMAFTQVRFNYYLAIVVAVFNAYLFGQILSWVDLDVSAREAVDDIDGYQVLAVVASILLILGPALAVPITVGNTQTSPAWQSAQNNGPGAVTVWDESLEWMQGNTPEEGNLGGAGNAEQMQYYGTYERTDDFEYPEGAYGVMSWWDYGHWITVEGERVPNANPFQQGATSAANFLLAPNETQSEEVLTSQSTEGDQTRYVMVDWQMATPGSKFGAPTVFYDAEENVSRDDFVRTLYRFDDENEGQFVGTTSVRTQRFYNSTMTKLYYYHGSAQTPSPIVVDWEDRQVQTGGGEAVTVPANPQGEGTFVQTFDNMSAAESYVEEDDSAQIGGVGQYPAERVEALEHYRLAHVSDTSAANSILRTTGREAQIAGINPQATVPSNPAWVKTFERVPGATVEGSGAPANTNVTAQVELRIPNTNSTFAYTQRAETDENGNFEMTLPYSTAGYDEYGPENGYTNVSVRATSPYTISSPGTFENGSIVTYQSNLSVSEGDVNGDDDGTVSVELERTEQELQIGGGSGDSESTDESGSTDGSDGSTSDTQSSLSDSAVQTDVARAN
ncbi:oligosaccharyl transferase, archaeosortase A system-associated [Halobellus limi]|uniref:dolichyl-phosphooligosaccharide-protein glycotransferase n=1 Tax=Halobellus limi TaxID=699433 RepID=A0A1H5US69_9EURY|nr:oligosaccharyl transferase, archaeosortase A system-associated [Halobellus limi]QCC46938.1 oligosaccharyl transferase, archaeosortase A system-associated [Halobellus limi]SEF77935.1 dolichyl-diphosphooligosaccharide--protein glycosyltransferase [Halobellus limi]